MSGLNRTAMLAEYQSVAIHGGVAAADPQRLILMLMDGVLDRIAQARGYMQRGRIADKGQTIGRALGLIQELRASLDLQQGGDIAANLETLYDYCSRQLVLANANNQPEVLDTVAALIHEIRGAWAALPSNPKPGTSGP